MGQQSSKPVGWDANGRPLFSLPTPQPTSPVPLPQGWDADGRPLPAGAIQSRPEAARSVPQQLIDTGLGTLKEAAKASISPVVHPIDTAIGIATMPYQVLKSHADEAQKAWEAFQRGDRSEGVLRALASIVPVAGPIIANYVDSDQAGKEQIAGGMIGGIVLGRVLQSPRGVPISPAMRNTNPVTQEAVNFARQQGIPVDAATATGNPVVRGTQYLADRSLGGALVAPRAQAAQEAALTSTGRRLAADAHPAAVSPYQAGEAVLAETRAKVAQYGSEANQAYDALRTIEESPAQTRKVTMRILTTAADGTTKMSTVTVDMQMPVDLRAAKAQLKPIRDRMKRQMPVAQQNADEGLKAISNIVDAPDFLPASMVDLDLSAIKAIQRGDTGMSHALSSTAVMTLERELQKAVAQGGPDAIDALQAGRKATIAKVGAKDLLTQLREEPRQVFDQATWANDAGIDRLRKIQKEAPGSLPQVGRAYLDDLMDSATSEGGFAKAQGLQAKWQKLGAQTKELLFPDKQLRSDLDNFFLAAKQMQANPNPSGTGHIISLGTQGALTLTEPITGATLALTGAALSKLLHSSAGVRMLTNGIRIPIGGNKTAAIAAFGALQNAIKDVK